MECKRHSFVKAGFLFLAFGTILCIIHFSFENNWQDPVNALKNIQIFIKDEQLTTNLTPCDVDFRSPITEADDEYTKIIKTRIFNSEKKCPANKPTSDPLSKVYMISRHIAVDRFHKLIFVPVPKIASTSLQRVFSHIAAPELQNTSINDINKMSYWKMINKIPRLSKFTHFNVQSKVQWMLEDYYKFTFVREPFSRILSAFRNKFMSHPDDYYRKKYGKLATQYEDTFSTEVNPNTAKQINGRLFTFRSFFRYLARTGCEYYNAHWGCYLSRTLPCEMKYDFIGELETIQDDFNFLSRCKLKVGKFEDIFTNSKPSSNDAYNEFYATVEDEDILKVYEIFQNEYDYFGYPMPDIVSDAKDRFLRKGF